MLTFEFLYKLRFNLNVGLSFKQKGKTLVNQFNVNFWHYAHSSDFFLRLSLWSFVWLKIIFSYAVCVEWYLGAIDCCSVQLQFIKGTKEHSLYSILTKLRGQGCNEQLWCVFSHGKRKMALYKVIQLWLAKV